MSIATFNIDFKPQDFFKDFVGYVKSNRKKLNRQRIIRDLLYQLRHHFPDHNVAVINPSEHFAHVSGKIIDENLNFDDFFGHKMRVLVFREGTIANPVNKEKGKKWGVCGNIDWHTTEGASSKGNVFVFDKISVREKYEIYPPK